MKERFWSVSPPIGALGRTLLLNLGERAVSRNGTSYVLAMRRFILALPLPWSEHYTNNGAPVRSKGSAYSIPVSNAAFPPTAAVLIETVCSVAKRGR
jgi:hypothetical protein